MKATNIDINFEKNYTHGHGTEICGCICARHCGSVIKFLASGMCESKWFKTLKGAEKFMEARGYKAA